MPEEKISKSGIYEKSCSDVQSGETGSEERDVLFNTLYEELKRIAHNIRRDRPNTVLSTTTLVHEAWLKLEHSCQARFESELHLKRTVARAMRQLLVDMALRYQAQKRAGVLVELKDDLDEPLGASDRAVIALHDALGHLAAVNPRQAKLVELRFFGGFSVAEVAEMLGLSESTVERDWRYAKAWLASEMQAPEEE